MLDSKPKRTRRTKAQMAEGRAFEIKDNSQDAPSDQSVANVLIVVPNVWGDDCKFLQFDIVGMRRELADFLVERGQARITSDAATVEVNRDVRPFKRVDL